MKEEVHHRGREYTEIFNPLLWNNSPLSVYLFDENFASIRVHSRLSLWICIYLRLGLFFLSSRPFAV
jgi:hypothetical protein